MSNDVLILLFAFSGSFCFGLTAVILKAGVENQDILFGLIIRALGSAPILLVLNIIVSGSTFFIPFISLEMILLVMLAASLMILTDLILMHSLKNGIPVGVIVPVMAVNPLFTLMLLIATGQAIMSLEILLLAVFIIAGIILVTYEPESASGNVNENRGVDWRALGAGLAAAFFMGLMVYTEIMILKKDGVAGLSYSAVKISFLGLIGTLGLFLAGNRVTELKLSFSRKSSVKYLLLAGFVGWTVGAVLVYSSFDAGPATVINFIVGLSPVFAVIVSLMLKMENTSRMKLTGILLCTISSIFLVM